MRSKLAFSNGHFLYFEALSSPSLPDAEFCRERGIANLYLYQEGHRRFLRRRRGIKAGLKGKKWSRTEQKALSNAGVELATIDLTRLTSVDFSSLRKIFANIQRALKRGNCLLLYNSEQEHQAGLFACCFLVGLNFMRNATPQRCIEYIFSRPAEERDNLVYHFKKFLHSDYQFPQLPIKSNFKLGKQTAGFESDQKDQNLEKEFSKKHSNLKGSKKRGFSMESNAKESISSATEHLKDQVDEKEGVKAGSPAFTKRGAASFQTEADKGAASFRPSPLTIRLKLIAAIALLIFVSLGAMVYLASAFFGAESEVRIQENNINLVRVVGQRVRSELKNIAYLAQLTAQALLQEDENYSETFFENNPDVIFVGLARQAERNFNFASSIYNSDYMSLNNVTVTNLQAVHQENHAYFQQAAAGAFVVHNASQDKMPLLAVSQPATAGYIVVLYLEPTRFFQAFKKEGIVTIFMVNNKGEVIAHPESEVYLSRASFINSPIVKTMFESTVTTGQTRYVEAEEGEAYLGSYQRIESGNLGIVASVKEGVVFAPVRKLQERNLYIMMIIVVVSVLFLYFFAKTITAPIATLVGATKEVESGNFQIEIEPAFRDEIGSLTHSFRSMTIGLGERERIKDAFGKFVNKELAEMALKGDIQLGGEKRYAAIFFSDLRNFTAMSEKMPPDHVVAYLNEYFTAMVQCINDTYGVVDKYIGDAIMAHWGAVRTKGNETENAINAALKMRGALIEFNRRGAGKRPIAQMGSGINTGEVISGQIGSQDRLEYTVIGDPVNLASRIEALNKPFQTDILISENAYQRVKDLFKVAKMPSIKVKGKEKPQAVYAVIGKEGDPDCPKDIDHLRKLLGMDSEAVVQKAPDSGEQKFQVLQEKS